VLNPIIKKKLKYEYQINKPSISGVRRFLYCHIVATYFDINE